MHTPDGIITSWICVLYLLPSIGITLFSLWKLRHAMTREKALGIASIAALIFGLQMLNFPINPGTSGHFVGAALLAILFGPYAAVVGLALVLIVQAIAFGDGGALALGLNIFHMAIVGGFVAHYAYQALKTRSRFLAAISASVASVVAAAVSCTIALAIGGASAFIPTLMAMVPAHFFIGLGEAIITILALFALSRFTSVEPIRIEWKNALVIGGVASLVALPFISTQPDGLTRVAINLGFYSKAITLAHISPFSGYTLFGMSGYLASVAVAAIGMGIIFGTGFAILTPRRA